MFGDFWFDEKFELTEVEKGHKPMNLGTFGMLTGSPNKVAGDPY